MYLEKIEIHGFKSFGDSVKLTIPKGITAVIGPNGSGKSNVADAIRWVLGEQSAKTLRGTKMEDIIFAGTEKRKPLGYAEVALHIHNTDRALPIDYAEVVVKRRVYRSGESEYFLNGSICRLKDIQELFMDTGIGKEGYSIIGQGQIDKILSSKPEDRRSLFEEAAGIYKYKVRRIEAEKKLDKERDNLDRVNDIVHEIEERLEPLEIEAEKTKRYLSLKDELKLLDLNIYIEEVGRIKEDMKKLLGNMDNIGIEIGDHLDRKETVAKEHQEWKQNREALFKRVEELITEVGNLEKREQQKQSDVQISKERIASIDILLHQIEKDTKKQESDQKNMQVDLQVLLTKKVGLDLEESTQKEILHKAEEKFEAMVKALDELVVLLETSKKQIYDKVREVDAYRLEMDKQEALYEELDYREDEIKASIEQLGSEMAHQEVSVRVKQKKLETLTETFDAERTNYEQLTQEKKSLDEQTVRAERSLGELEQTIVQTSRQVGWLEQIKNDHEGYFQSVKQVLSLKQTDPKKWAGIIGIVGELLEVDKNYELAIVTALGGAMQNIVASTEQDAKQMIATMKQRGIGRVTFLPLNTVQAYAPPKEMGALRNEDGFLGLASELVSYDQAYSPAIAYLLGRILIVDTMDHASHIAKKYGYRYKIVTLEGEVFNAGGTLSGGSSKNNKNNIFARTRELKELKEAYAKYLVDCDTAKGALETLRESQSACHSKWQALRDTLEQLHAQKQEIGLEIRQAESELELTKKSQHQLVVEKAKLAERREVIGRGQEAIVKTIEELEGHIDEAQANIQTRESEIETQKKVQEEMREALTQKRIALSNTSTNRTHIVEQIQTLEKNLANTKDQHQSIAERKEELGADKAKLYVEIEKLEEEIVNVGIQIEETKASKVTFETKRTQLEVEEAEIEARIQKESEVLENLKAEQLRLENKKEILELERQKHNDHIWEQYEMTYGGALVFKQELGAFADMRKNAEKLRGQIKVIGHVNVNAVAEYEETHQRYTFLTTQREDIQKAERTLVEMIDRLTAEMHDIFREQFKHIAENFSQVFQELFGGGMAFLQLMDEENILESGIEIIAKPPGKKLQNMTLLSGGERTLTAIALLFGILKLKPSPFCVLDEIEAALDDANVLRFAEYLGNLSKETQFVVITHRKGTMERADTLYGVTMQERGVSTVLSIKLEDATQYLDQKNS
ncbi:MAG: chromosome segregation protein SMC [Cellulosilyticaceae bacterium]